MLLSYVVHGGSAVGYYLVYNSFVSLSLYIRLLLVVNTSVDHVHMVTDCPLCSGLHRFASMFVFVFCILLVLHMAFKADAQCYSIPPVMQVI